MRGGSASVFVIRNLQVLERTGEHGRRMGSGRVLGGKSRVIRAVGRELAEILLFIVLVIRSQTMSCTGLPRMLNVSFGLRPCLA